MGDWVRRRDFIRGLVGSASLWPLVVRAQPAVPVIGFLSPESPDLFVDRMGSFRAGLGEAGYIEGQNLSIEYRWAEGRVDHLPALAAELVQRQVNVLVRLAVRRPHSRQKQRRVRFQSFSTSEPTRSKLVLLPA